MLSFVFFGFVGEVCFRQASPSLRQLDAADAHIPAGSRTARPVDTGRPWCWKPSWVLGWDESAFLSDRLSLLADSLCHEVAGWERFSNYFFGWNSKLCPVLFQQRLMFWGYHGNRKSKNWKSDPVLPFHLNLHQQSDLFIPHHLGICLEKPVEPVTPLWSSTTADFCTFSFSSAVGAVFELRTTAKLLLPWLLFPPLMAGNRRV